MNVRTDSYLAIAIDHGASFDSWLRAWDTSLDARRAVKRGILAGCLRAGVDGLVLSETEFDGALADLCRRASTATTDIWVGIPDLVVLGQYDGAHSGVGRFSPESGLSCAEQYGARGLKVGVKLAAQATWSDAKVALASLLELSRELGLEVVVEPYFRKEVDEEDVRTDFLDWLRVGTPTALAKLDVHQPERWGAAYSHFPGWLARSEGLKFDDYRRNLQASVADGCGGTMVGEAVWGITGSTVNGLEYWDKLSDRIAVLRDTFSVGP